MPPVGGEGAWNEQTGSLRMEGKPRRSRHKKCQRHFLCCSFTKGKTTHIYSEIPY